MMEHALAWTDFHRGTVRRTLVIFTVLAVIATYQFTPVVHLFVPLQILGKNLYTVLPAAIMVLVSLLLLPAIWRAPVTPAQARVFMALVFIWLAVLLSRTAIYADGIDFLRARYLLLFFMFSAVLRYVAVDPVSRSKMAKVLIAAMCLQAVIGIVHTYFFPFVGLVADPGGELEVAIGSDESGGETGTLLTRSNFGDVLVCGQFALLVERRIPFTLRAVIMLVMFYAVTLGGARYAEIWSALLTAALFINRKMDRAAPVMLALIVLAGIFMAVTGWTPFEIQSELRFDQDSGSRGEKLGLLIDTLSNYWPLSAFIGVPVRAALTAMTATGVVISDDSYGEITLDFGLAGLLLFLTGIFVWLVRWPMSILSTLMLIYLFGNFALTNSVLWDVWLFYFLAAWWLVYTGTRTFTLGAPHPLPAEASQ